MLIPLQRSSFESLRSPSDSVLHAPQVRAPVMALAKLGIERARRMIPDERSTSMILTLQVVGERVQDLGAESRKVFKATGGTIGRYPDNDWIFADPYVSGRHALIRYINGTYYIEDTSTNGVYINSLDNRLPKGQPYPLRDGDRLYIDTFEVEVSIRDDRETEPRHDLFDGSLLNDVFGAHAGPAAFHPARRSCGEAENADLFTAMLRAAGLERLEASSDTAHVLGTLLRRALQGIVDASRARRQIEGELGLQDRDSETTRRNPFEQCSHVDEALHQLLTERDPAACAPLAALDEVLRDLRDHQDALWAASRLAGEALLARLDPEQLEGVFGRQLKKGMFFSVLAKFRYWDLYRERYYEAMGDDEVARHELFRRELAQLKALR